MLRVRIGLARLFVLSSVVSCAAFAPAAASAQEPVLAGTVAVVHRPDGTVFSAISEAQYDRFFSAALSQAQQRSIANVVPLVAPEFAACVHGKRWIDGGRRPRTVGGRRRVCERTYFDVRNHAMHQLLSLTTLLLEADARAMVFTDRRIARERQTTIDEQFAGMAGYRRFLWRSGLNEDDVRLNLIARLAQDAIVRQIGAPWEGKSSLEDLESVQRAIEDFRTAFLERSAAATTCAAPYLSLEACGGTVGAAPE